MIGKAKCNICGKTYDFLHEAMDCSALHYDGGEEYKIDASFHQIEPIEYIECTIELPKRSEDDNK